MKDTWDPLRIIFQITTVQIVYYILLGVCILLLDLFFGHDPLLDQLFNPNRVSFHNSFEVIAWVGPVVVAFVSAVVLLFVVARPRKILDFSITRFILHFLACCIYSASFPISWAWWLSHAIATVIETVLGEYLCVRREVQDIPQLSVLHV